MLSVSDLCLYYLLITLFGDLQTTIGEYAIQSCCRTEQNRTEQNFINLTTSQATRRRHKRRKKLQNEQSK